MTDGHFIDKNNNTFGTLYGGGHMPSCLQLLPDSNTGECSGGAVFCEISLFKDTHICLNRDFLSSVSLNESTELEIPSSVST